MSAWVGIAGADRGGRRQGRGDGHGGGGVSRMKFRRLIWDMGYSPSRHGSVALPVEAVTAARQLPNVLLLRLFLEMVLFQLLVQGVAVDAQLPGGFGLVARCRPP